MARTLYLSMLPLAALAGCFNITAPAAYKCTDNSEGECPAGFSCKTGACVAASQDLGVSADLAADLPTGDRGAGDLPVGDGLAPDQARSDMLPLDQQVPPDQSCSSVTIDALLGSTFFRDLNFVITGTCCSDLILDYKIDGGSWGDPLEVDCVGGTFSHAQGYLPDLDKQKKDQVTLTATFTDQDGATAEAFTVVAVCAGQGLQSTAAHPFAFGSGAEADPYRVCTMVQLDKVRDYLSSHFALYHNINATNYTSTMNIEGQVVGQGFEPIHGPMIPGSEPQIFEGFSGTFNGRGYAITNLQIQWTNQVFVGGSPVQARAGLFYSIVPDGAVMDLRLENVVIASPSLTTPDCRAASGQSTAGALTGVNEGTISRCSVQDGTVYGYSPVGGLVGSSSGTIQNSLVRDVTVGGECIGGGLAGEVTKGHVWYSYAVTPVIISGTVAAGFVGVLGQESQSDSAEILGCFANPFDTSQPTTSLGMTAGIQDNGSFMDSYCALGGTNCLGPSSGVYSVPEVDPNLFKNGDTTTPPGLFSSWSPTVWDLSAGDYPHLL